MQIYSVDCYLATGTVVHVLINKDEYVVGSYMYHRVANTTPLFTKSTQPFSSSILSHIFDRISFNLYLNNVETLFQYFERPKNPFKPKYTITSKLNTFKRITLNDWMNQ